jgi:hypothetical protein
VDDNYNQMDFYFRHFYTSILRIFTEDQLYSLDSLVINIEKFIHEIEKGGLDLEGIYKNSGSKFQLDTLMKDFQKFSYFDVKKWDEVDNKHVIPSLFKQYIRDLPLIKNNFFKLLSKPLI